jgi:hypothetical protein
MYGTLNPLKSLSPITAAAPILDRLLDVIVPIHKAALHGDEKIARLHRATIDGNASDLDIWKVRRMASKVESL